VPPIDWGALRRLTPVSDQWGFDRGGALDRYYIEAFLARYSRDIAGRVLEVKDSQYTQRFGHDINGADVLDINPNNTRATIHADLSGAVGIGATDTFDCFILTQTLHQIYDIKCALRNARRVLKPGGVLLCTVPSVTRVDSHYEGDGHEESDYWRFTRASVERLFAEVFPSESLTVHCYGNVLTCVAFLYGLAPGELTQPELDFVDPWFPLVFCIRAVRPASGS
jgi:SAM-dependent methyltransferase